jgi:hypothetical protein
MAAVKIKGTFGKDSRPHNGLEAIAEKLCADPYMQVLVVGIVRPHRIVTEVGEEPVPTVEFIAIEAVLDGDAATVQKILDDAARHRGVPVPEPLPFGDDQAEQG